MSAVGAAGEGSLCPSTGSEFAEVSGFTDTGALVLADGRPVRLAGIDLPTPPLALQAGETWPALAAAIAAMAGATASHAISYVPAGAIDRHGRLPVYAFLPDGRSLQDILLADGMARARWLPGETICFGRFLAVESVAREAGAGLWTGPEYATRAADDASLRAEAGLYALVEGRVVSVGHGARMIFLDFGPEFRRDFTVMVPPGVADGLAAAGNPADGLRERRVRVRGVIEESGGPAIRLNDPAEIEVLD